LVKRYRQGPRPIKSWRLVMDISIETDKLMETYSFRIPEITKNSIEKMSRSQKNNLNRRLLIEISRAIHDSNFDPELYLKTGE